MGTRSRSRSPARHTASEKMICVAWLESCRERRLAILVLEWTNRGSPDFAARQFFTKDEEDAIAVAIALRCDMGFPLDMGGIGVYASDTLDNLGRGTDSLTGSGSCAALTTPRISSCATPICANLKVAHLTPFAPSRPVARRDRQRPN